MKGVISFISPMFLSLSPLPQYGTMVLVMASLLEEMKKRPRYWLRLLQVLLQTVAAKDVPSQVLQVGGLRLLQACG